MKLWMCAVTVASACMGCEAPQVAQSPSDLQSAIDLSDEDRGTRLKEVLARGTSANSQVSGPFVGQDPESALRYALSRGRRTAVYLLLDKGARIADLKPDANQALVDAARMDCESVKVLVDGGLDLGGGTESHDGTPLHALAVGRYEAPGEPRSFGGTYQEFKTEEHRRADRFLRYNERAAEIGAWLISEGVKVDARNYFGETAMTLATKNDRDTCFLRMLIKHGADVNADEPVGRPLSCAARAGNVAAVKMLLAAGASKRGENCLGKTALDEVGDIASLLKRYGARDVK